ncbi:hypothetical protein TNCV_192401 [Trichonephila clavipes]|nr:hypothetical protein TNCV_192401 [Trichonephila clavipes]
MRTALELALPLETTIPRQWQHVESLQIERALVPPHGKSLVVSGLSLELSGIPNSRGAAFKKLLRDGSMKEDGRSRFEPSSFGWRGQSINLMVTLSVPISPPILIFAHQASLKHLASN